MIIRVQRHGLDADAASAIADELLADDTEGAGLLWCIGALEHYGEIIGEISRLAIRHAALRLAADPHAVEVQTRLATRHAINCAVAIFKSASIGVDSGAVGDVDVDWVGLQAIWGPFRYEDFDEEVDFLPGLHTLGPWYAADAVGWLTTFWLACIGGHIAVEPLVRYPMADLRRAHEYGQDEFCFSYIKAIRALHEGDPDLAAETIGTALAQITQSQLEDTRLQQLWLPQLNLFEMLITATGDTGGSALFNDALAAALQAHRTFWSADERSCSDDGFVAWPLLAMSIWAIDRGITIEVDSEYLPAFFLRERMWMTNAITEPIPSMDVSQRSLTQLTQGPGDKVHHVARHMLDQAPATEALNRHAALIVVHDLPAEPNMLGLLSILLHSWAVSRLVTDPLAQDEFSRRLIRLDKQLAIARITHRPDESFRFRFEDQAFELPPTNSCSFMAPRFEDWRNAFWLALVARDDPAVRSLVDSDMRSFCDDGPAGEQERAQFDALKAMVCESGQAPGLLRATLSVADCLPAGPARKHWSTIAHWPFALFALVLSGEQEIFTGSFIEALHAHKKFYGLKKNTGDLGGVVSWPLTAVACYALDHGMAVPVESEYLPEHLLRHRNWVGELAPVPEQDSLLSLPRPQFLIIEPQDWRGVWISRHTIDVADATQRARELTPQVQAALLAAEHDPGALAGLHDVAKTRTELLLAADPNAESLETRRMFRLAIEAGFALFGSAQNEEERDDSLALDDRQILWPTTAPLQDFTMERWLSTHWLSRTYLMVYGTMALECFERESFATSPPIDEFHLAWWDVVRRHYPDDEQITEALRFAREAKHAPTELIEQIYLPQINLLAAYSARDRTAPESAVVAALEGHRTYWSATPERRQDPAGFVCWPVLGIVGGGGTVRSEYLPQALATPSWSDDLPSPWN